MTINCPISIAQAVKQTPVFIIPRYSNSHQTNAMLAGGREFETANH